MVLFFVYRDFWWLIDVYETNLFLMHVHVGLTNEIDDLKAQVNKLSGEVDRFT